MSSLRFKVMCIVGARPNFMKIAPIMKQFSLRASEVATVLLHTGQHYDHAMKTLLFDQLQIPVPDIDLEVRGGSHAEQTAHIMLKFEPVLDEIKPDAILVVGDVNSTIACALVSIKKHIPVIHVEAGLRSGDMAMPEEVNRVLTDKISQKLYTTERLGNENLLKEGVKESCIRFVGNVMIDTLLANQKIAPELTTVEATYKLAGFLNKRAEYDGKFAFVTMHRPSNVDNPETLKSLLRSLNEVALHLPVVFAVHPRTRKNIEQFGLLEQLASKNIFTCEPVGYLDSITLMSKATMVLTDSGGIQEETTALGVPCITLRENTERWITVHEGTNTVVGTSHGAIMAAVNEIMAGKGKAGRRPELWDGHAAERIVEDLLDWFKSNGHKSLNV